MKRYSALILCTFLSFATPADAGVMDWLRTRFGGSETPLQTGQQPASLPILTATVKKELGITGPVPGVMRLAKYEPEAYKLLEEIVPLLDGYDKARTLFFRANRPLFTGKVEEGVYVDLLEKLPRHPTLVALPTLLYQKITQFCSLLVGSSRGFITGKPAGWRRALRKIGSPVGILVAAVVLAMVAWRNRGGGAGNSSGSEGSGSNTTVATVPTATPVSGRGGVGFDSADASFTSTPSAPDGPPISSAPVTTPAPVAPAPAPVPAGPTLTIPQPLSVVSPAGPRQPVAPLAVSTPVAEAGRGVEAVDAVSAVGEAYKGVFDESALFFHSDKVVGLNARLWTHENMKSKRVFLLRSGDLCFEGFGFSDDSTGFYLFNKQLVARGDANVPKRGLVGYLMLKEKRGGEPTAGEIVAETTVRDLLDVGVLYMPISERGVDFDLAHHKEKFLTYHGAPVTPSLASCLGYAEVQQRRSTQEDSMIMRMNDHWVFCGVFDGHGGDQTSLAIADENTGLSNCLFARLGDGSGDINATIKQAYKGFDETLARAEMGQSGSTAIVLLLNRDTGELRLINLGDSRAVLCDTAGSVVAATRDHKPSDEVERVREAGGYVEMGRVQSGSVRLAVARAFGDFELKPEGIVQRSNVSTGETEDTIPDATTNRNYQVGIEPDITTINLGTTIATHAVLACDGLWDGKTNEKAAAYIRDNAGRSETELAEGLVREVYPVVRDNISTIVINLEKLKDLLS